MKVLEGIKNFGRKYGPAVGAAGIALVSLKGSVGAQEAGGVEQQTCDSNVVTFECVRKMDDVPMYDRGGIFLGYERQLVADCTGGPEGRRTAQRWNAGTDQCEKEEFTHAQAVSGEAGRWIRFGE